MHPMPHGLRIPGMSPLSRMDLTRTSLQSVSGAGHDPESLANKVQGRIQEVWNARTHDVGCGLS